MTSTGKLLESEAGHGLDIDQVSPPAAVIIRPGAADNADLARGAQDAIQRVGQLPLYVNGKDPFPGAQVELDCLFPAANRANRAGQHNERLHGPILSRR